MLKTDRLRSAAHAMWVAILVFAWAVAAHAAQTLDVSQMGRAFHPDSLDIKVGDTVRFRNDDEFLHHIYVHSPQFTFDSAEQPPGQAVEVTFTHAGDFEVRCEIHPKMHLTVHVR